MIVSASLCWECLFVLNPFGFCQTPLWSWSLAWNPSRTRQTLVVEFVYFCSWILGCINLYQSNHSYSYWMTMGFWLGGAHWQKEHIPFYGKDNGLSFFDWSRQHFLHLDHYLQLKNQKGKQKEEIKVIIATNELKTMTRDIEGDTEKQDHE